MFEELWQIYENQAVLESNKDLEGQLKEQKESSRILHS